MRAFLFGVGIICAVVGTSLAGWGAVGRFLDKHTYSEDDGPAMFYGSVIAAWGAFLLVVWW